MSIVSELEMSNLVKDKINRDLEKEIIRGYKKTNTAVKNMFGELYQKYETGGVLTYSEIMKYNRLKEVQKQVNKEIVELYAHQKSMLNSKLKDVYENSYMRTGYALENDLKAKLSYVLLDPKKIMYAIQNPISGLTLNQTLSKNRSYVVSKINQEIIQGLIKGESYGKMSKRISKVFGGDAGKAIRVAQTETHRVHNQASYDSVIHADNLGVKMKKVWISTFDGSTRPAHQSLDGVKVDPKADFHSSAGGVGKTPGNLGNAGDDINCRCTFIIEVEGVKNDFRRVRGEGVIPYTTYDEWAKERGIKPINARSKKTKENDINKIISSTKTNLSEADKYNSLGKYVGSDGELLKEREMVHQEILRDLFKDAKPVKDPKMYLLGGGTASGKSSIIRSGKVKFPKNNVMVDSDSIKGKLSEYKKMLRLNDKNAAAFVHAESSAIAKRAISIANKNSYNVVLDGTGDGKLTSLMKKIDLAKMNNCRVVGYYVTCPVDVALKRELSRSLRTGRSVPKSIIMNNHKQVSNVMPKASKYFDEVYLYENIEEPILIGVGGGGKTISAVKGYEKEFKAFINKGVD